LLQIFLSNFADYENKDMSKQKEFQNLLCKFEANLAGIVLVLSPFLLVSICSDLHKRGLPLLKIENS
jgi:hypothetical protein